MSRDDAVGSTKKSEAAEPRVHRTGSTSSSLLELGLFCLVAAPPKDKPEGAVPNRAWPIHVETQPPAANADRRRRTLKSTRNLAQRLSVGEEGPQALVILCRPRRPIVVVDHANSPNPIGGDGRGQPRPPG